MVEDAEPEAHRPLPLLWSEREHGRAEAILLDNAEARLQMGESAQPEEELHLGEIPAGSRMESSAAAKDISFTVSSVLDLRMRY